ncbi:hypothetical protein ACC733_37655, partial [Rhizobium johnstonii]
RERARIVFESMTDDEVADITRIITSSLPGSTTEPLTIPAFREKLVAYIGIDAARLRRHLIEFLEALTPAAEQRTRRIIGMQRQLDAAGFG